MYTKQKITHRYHTINSHVECCHEACELVVEFKVVKQQLSRGKTPQHLVPKHAVVRGKQAALVGGSKRILATLLLVLLLWW